MAEIPAKFQITRPEIKRVVAAFYARIREHPELGPVFAAHVTDWPGHEDKVTRFWANMILHERDYDGNPLMVHITAGNVRPGMFEPWLELFDAVLRAELSKPQATAWSAMVHMIGRTLRAGMAKANRGEDGTPVLR